MDRVSNALFSKGGQQLPPRDSGGFSQVGGGRMLRDSITTIGLISIVYLMAI